MHGGKNIDNNFDWLKLLAFGPPKKQGEIMQLVEDAKQKVYFWVPKVLVAGLAIKQTIVL